MIALRENLGPGWPKEELAIGYNLVCLIRIGNQLSNSINQSMENLSKLFIYNENHDIAIAMSSSRADPMLGLNILQG